MIEKANLEVFADTLLELAKIDKDIIVVTSDSRGSGKLTRFGKELPDQIIEVGIAEQNLVGICAGLSAIGKKVQRKVGGYLIGTFGGKLTRIPERKSV